MVSCFSSRRREHLLQNRSREEVGKRSRDRKKPQGSRELRERAARGGRATTPTVAAPVADGDDATFRVALLPPCGFLRRFPAAHRAEEPDSPPQLHAVTQGEINQAAHALLLSLPLTFFTSRGNAEKSRSYCWLYDCASLLMTCSSHELAEEVAFPMSTARALDEWCVCRESRRGGGGEFLIPPVSVVGRSSSCRKKVLFLASTRPHSPSARSPSALQPSSLTLQMCRATRVRLPRAATGPTSTRRRCRSTGKRTGRRAQFGLQPRPSGSGSALLVARRSAATLAWGPARVASRAPPAQGSYDRERSCRRQYGRGTRARGAAEWERAGGTGGRNSGESENQQL